MLALLKMAVGGIMEIVTTFFIIAGGITPCVTTIPDNPMQAASMG